MTSRNLYEITIETEIVAYGVLPAFVGGSVIRIVLSDVAVNAGKGKLFVYCTGDRLDDKLSV